MKTTILGILTILAAVIGGAISFLKSGTLDLPTLGGMVMVGIGLIKAADQSVVKAQGAAIDKNSASVGNPKLPTP